MKAQETLEASEQSNILEAICNKAREYSKIKVGFETFEKSSPCIAVFSQPGAKYLSKNICGGFEASVPILIVYRGYPKSEKQKLQMMAHMEELGDYLCNRENYPNEEDRIVEKIAQTSVVSCSSVGNDGSCDYAVTLQVSYRKDDDF